MSHDFEALRREYQGAPLDEAVAARDPYAQFDAWFGEAMRSGAGAGMPNAMSLATVGADGRPSLRMVLLKRADAHGFSFFTNYDSRKGRELAARHHAALLLYWPELDRQVRIEGRVETTSAQESDEYFAQRPAGSRHAAIASPQSTVVSGRAELETRFSRALAQYGEQAPRPANWGGYRLVPDRIEFWQGRPNRLHDRLQYRLLDNGTWALERLAP